MNLDRILPVVAPLMKKALRGKQKSRERQFETTGLQPGRVVFLGDSISEFTDWEDWFPGHRTANRGIGGQAIGDLMGRLDTALVDPRAVSLLIGTNDLHGLGLSSEVDSIATQMRELVREIRTRAPAAARFVNSVMPRSPLFRDRIVALNTHYRAIASEAGATYVDLWPALADEAGAIRKDLSGDGVHLTAKGYAAWVEILRP